jgi:hypothetical protein
MFSSTLKMTVPASDNGASQGLLMPKLQYRFRILFDNFGISQPTTELTKQVMDFSRPNLEFAEIPIEVYNSRIYLAGKPTWQSVTVNLRDDVNGNVAKLVGEQIQKQFDFNEQASAASGIDYKFLLRCQILDGANGQFGPTAQNILEEWALYGCYIASANYGALNYGANEPATVALTIRFDNAVQSPLDSGPSAAGIGVNVGRTIGQNTTGIGTAGSTPQG